jgi:hypothetical protein
MYDTMSIKYQMETQIWLLNEVYGDELTPLDIAEAVSLSNSDTISQHTVREVLNHEDWHPITHGTSHTKQIYPEDFDIDSEHGEALETALLEFLETIPDGNSWRGEETVPSMLEPIIPSATVELDGFDPLNAYHESSEYLEGQWAKKWGRAVEEGEDLEDKLAEFVACQKLGF